MATINVEKFRKRILAEKARLEGDKARLHENTPMSQEAGELADYDSNHPGDMGTEMFEREKEEALISNLDALLAQIEEALAKIDAGTFGVCDRCGKHITEARLQALPYATFCIDCQSYIETRQ